MQLVPLTADHVDDALALLGAQYERERAAAPCLAPFERHAWLLRHNLLGAFTQGVRGFGAVADGRLCGYLVGTPLPRMLTDQTRVHCWDWAHAAAGPDRWTVYRRLYAAAAEVWVANGWLDHTIMAYAHDSEALDAWSSLGFGRFIVDAVRTTEPLGAAQPEGLTRRLATPDDVEPLMELVEGLARHVRAAPVWAVVPNLPAPQVYAADLRSGAHVIRLALAGERIVGYLRTTAREDYVAWVVERSTHGAITGAYTVPEWRGRGVLSWLLDDFLAELRERGHQVCSVDFEAANVPGAALWGRYFTPVCYCVTRRVDERSQQVEW